MIPRGLIVFGALLVFGGVNRQMLHKERLRTSGQVVYLELAPVDPRSLMQGDYMALDFVLARQLGAGIHERDADRQYTAVLSVDANQVGSFSRMDNGAPLTANEKRFRFRLRRGQAWLGTNAFFFQEGDAERYSKARYGEFRVSEDGEAMLVNLRGAFDGRG
jgi:uncharacterized membrane-anchored protein